MKGSSRRCAAGLALVLATGFVSSANAIKVLIDFGSNTSYRGVSVNPNPEPVTGLYWNSVQPGLYYGPTTTPLVTTTGAATTIAEGFTTPVGTDSYNGPAGETASGTPASHLSGFTLDPALGDFRSNAAAIDYAASAGSPCSFTLSGLDITKTYDLKFYGSHQYSAVPVTVYSVFSDSGNTNLMGSATLAVGTTGNVANLDKIATISGLKPLAPAPGGTPSLYIQFISEDGESNGYLNAMEVIESSATNMPGDANGDHHVDSVDFGIFLAHYGVTSGGTFDQGDFDANGKINTIDFNILAGAFGTSGAPTLGSVVPEPASLSVLALAGLVMRRRRD